MSVADSVHFEQQSFMQIKFFMLCHELNCVFVHIPKTAGMSIEQFLLERLGMGPDQRGKFLLAPNDDPLKGPPRLAHLGWQEYVSGGHLTESQLQAYFTFTVVRNPWARVVSLFHYLGHSNTTDFTDFVFNRFYRRLWRTMHWFVKPQVEFISNSSGQILVDRVLRFENLQSEFDAVCRRLKLDPGTLPHHNQSVKRKGSDREPYQAYYKDDTQQWITELFSGDIAAFGYSFD